MSVSRDHDHTATAAGLMAPAPARGSQAWVDAWKCAGCGVVMADLHRACVCPTECVGRGGRGFGEIALKIDPPSIGLIEDITEALEDSLGPDWDCRLGARYVAEMLASHGITQLRASLTKGEQP